VTSRAPLHVAHVNSEPGFSGGEAQMFLLLRGLRERGHGDLVICRPGSRTELAAREEGFEVVTVSMRNDLDARAVPAIRRVLRERAVDLVHLHTGRATWLGGLAAKLAGVPALSTRRMDRVVRRGPRTRLVYGALTRRVVAISPAVVELLRRGGVDPARIELIPDAVEPRSLEPARGAREVRRSLGLESGRLALLSLASLDRRKGLDVLLEALARLRERRADPLPALWIAGSGPEEGPLRQLVADLRLGESVDFLGRREDAPDLLGACDVFVLPSRREGMGVAALEAMAVGKPVVASRVGGLAHAVESEGTGLLVPPEDPGALAAALERVLDDAELRERLSANGPARVTREFLAEDQVDRYAEVYAQVLQDAPVPLRSEGEGSRALRG